MTRSALHSFRHDKELAVFAGQIAVVFVVLYVAFGLLINRQLLAHAAGSLVQRYLVFLQMIRHAGQGFVGFLVVAERFRGILERLAAAEDIADVAEMAKGAR